MDFVPSPRKAPWPHVAIPFLSDISCFPDPDSWRSTLPNKVNDPFAAMRDRCIAILKKPSSAEKTSPEESDTEVFFSDNRKKAINPEPVYFDLYPQADEREKGSFLYPEGETLKSHHESAEACVERVRRDLGISDAIPIRYEEYFKDRCVLSERAKRAKPRALPAATQQHKPGQSYDGGGFKSFPGRQGLESWMLDYKWDSDEFCAFFHQLTPEETAVFVQSWLFFGLLSEVFGKQVREKDFVTTVDAEHEIITLQKFITTDQWKSWESEIAALGPEEQKSRADAIRYALDTASKMTRLEDRGTTISLPRRRRFRPGSQFKLGQHQDLLTWSLIKWLGHMKHIPFSGEIALSIRVLGAIFSEICCSHRSSIAGVFDLPQRFQTCQQWGIGEILSNRLMKERQSLESVGSPRSAALTHLCPNDIARMKIHLPVTAIYYLSNLRGGAGAPSLGLGARVNHSDCSDAHCVGDSIDEAVYKTEHSILCPGNCRFVEPDMKKVEEILEHGGIPIFRFKKSDPNDGLFTSLTWESQAAWASIMNQCTFEMIRAMQKSLDEGFKDDRIIMGSHEYDDVPPDILWQGPLELEVLRYDGKTPYVAISHVWADGLGNVKGNGIPACRLPFIRRMLWQSNCPMRLHPGLGVDKGVLDYLGHVHEVQASGATWALTQTPIPAFWIDTFGVPRHSSAKRVAVQRMSDTYRNSSKVLVIDGRLVGGPAGGRARGLHCEIRPVDDILGRILITPWMRRLWTLQEGLLAKELLFMFTEGPVDAQNLLDGVIALRTGPDDSPGALVREQLARGIASMVVFDASEDCTFKFRTVWNASVGRTATKPGDISLCLATALGMDASQLYDAAENERSKTFYSLLPRLAVDRGHGITMSTIDSSMLFSSQDKLPDYGFRWADRELCGEPLTPSTEAAIVALPHIGLLLDLPAAEISLPFAALGRSHWNLQLPGQGQILEVTVHRRFKHLEQTSTDVFFLILENHVDWSKPSAGRSRGLLASLDLRVPRLSAALDQLCIECYVEVSPSECLTSTISDIESDVEGVGPCFKLGDFRDLLVILR